MSGDILDPVRGDGFPALKTGSRIVPPLGP